MSGLNMMAPGDEVCNEVCNVKLHIIKLVLYNLVYIVSCRGASQLGGSLLGIPPGYKANKL